MKTLWQIIGKMTEPIISNLSPFEQGECTICIPFPDEGTIVIDFYWSADVAIGQKSHDPLVPDDPGFLICTSFRVNRVLNYDIEGSEFPVRVTDEITQLFIQFIKDYELINVDEYDL